jgi:hypothetical protein
MRQPGGQQWQLALRGLKMSSLSDRRRHKSPSTAVPASPWKDFAAALIFAAIGLSVTVYAIVEGIPIGEHVMWGN